MSIGLSVSNVGEAVLENGNPANENNNRAARQTGKENHFNSASCEEHQRLSHIDPN